MSQSLPNSGISVVGSGDAAGRLDCEILRTLVSLPARYSPVAGASATKWTVVVPLGACRLVPAGAKVALIWMSPTDWALTFPIGSTLPAPCVIEYCKSPE